MIHILSGGLLGAIAGVIALFFAPAAIPFAIFGAGIAGYTASRFLFGRPVVVEDSGEPHAR